MNKPQQQWWKLLFSANLHIDNRVIPITLLYLHVNDFKLQS